MIITIIQNAENLNDSNNNIIHSCLVLIGIINFGYILINNHFVINHIIFIIRYYIKSL